MSSRVLTSNIADINAFLDNPCGVLCNAENGITAIFIKNTPVFYAITPTRLAQLLKLESYLAHPESDIKLDTRLFDEPLTSSVIPIGKFAMYSNWQPDSDFLRQAALWGIDLTEPITPGELTAFIAWWKAEGKVFTHIQWQQKLARNVQLSRASSRKIKKRDINTFSQPDRQIPHGFRGAK